MPSAVIDMLTSNLGLGLGRMAGRREGTGVDSRHAALEGEGSSPFEILGGVDGEPGEGVVGGFCFDDPEGESVFEDAELFERFGEFEGGGGEFGELEEKGAPVGVQPNVFEGGLGGGVSREGDEGAGEIEGVAVAIDDDLDDAGFGCGFRMRGALHERGHGKRWVVEERLNGFVDHACVDERLVALDVDDDVAVDVLDGLGEPIRAAGMVGGGHDGAAAGGRDGAGDPVVVGGDEDVIEGIGEPASFEDALDHGFPGDLEHGFAGEPGRGEAGGDEAEDAGT